MTSIAEERVARVLIEFQPYLGEIVLVGGWVHALYLSDLDETGGVFTEDIDISVPTRLQSDNRPPLLELAARAGFEKDPISEMGGAGVWMVSVNSEGMTVPIDFLTEGLPKALIPIAGQPGLTAMGYPGQRVLLENTRTLLVGPTFHPLISRPIPVLVPTLGAYVLQKGVSAGTRIHAQKRAKDIVYMLEIVSHPKLGPDALTQLAETSGRYEAETKAFSDTLRDALENSRTLDDVVEQMLLSRGRRGDPSSVRAQQRAWLRRMQDQVAR